jgi:hypothetical protein
VGSRAPSSATSSPTISPRVWWVRQPWTMPTSRLARARASSRCRPPKRVKVIEGAGTGTECEGGEGPQIAGVGEAAIAGVAGERTVFAEVRRCLPEVRVTGDAPA